MPTELAKTYDPSAVEAEAYRVWIEENCFTADPAKPGEPYCIVIPPPNVTGALHLGHAINDTLQDILIRHHRMRGFNALWIPGIDHAGIATQAVVEKQLKEQENKTRHDVGREGLVERIWKWKQQYGDRILEQLKRLGCSCDWTRTHFTLDETCARAVRETFFKLFKDGLIYRGKRLVNWDTFLQTSISDDEIYHETVKTSLWHIRYEISEEGRRDEGTKGQSGDASAPSVPLSLSPSVPSSHMTVATTRPETMLGDTAVAVHPDDPRWNWAIGKHVRLSLTDRLIPIIADPILVDPKFGTGVVKVTPAHDPNDYAVWQRHKGQADEIDLINILTPDGRLVDDPRWKKYAGMKREAARKQVVEDLKAAGLLEKEEPYETQVGHSDRSKTPIEPYLSDQWFVKMAPLAEPALEVVREDIIQFFPSRYANTYLDWLGEKRDWPISRQLWWGHRIPVWREEGTDEETAATVDGLSAMWPGGNGTYYCIRREQKSDGRYELAICFRDPDRCGPIIKTLEEEFDLVQDPDVLDTWFSSALWPHSTLGWPEPTADLAKWYPTSVLTTARDIITLWVARMVMTGMYNMGDHSLPPLPPGEGRGEGGLRETPNSTGKSASASPHPNPLPGGEGAERQPPSALADSRDRALGIPFKHVYIHPTILDGKGERMSKSKGNGVDPVDIIDTHGADALRFTLTQMATETQDARMPVKKDAKGRNTSDKFDLGRNFCNKLWNAARFALSNLETIKPEPVDESKWSLVDRWIVSRFNRTLDEVNAAIASYRFDVYAKACYDFFWRDFCDWYVEAAKPALKDPQRAGATANVLASTLDGALRLMHPMIPFITETIWWRLNEVWPERGLPGRIASAKSKRLVAAAWPAVGSFAEASEFLFPKIQEIVVAIRNVRNEYIATLPKGTDAKAEAKRVLTVSVRAPGDACRTVNENRGVIELLATCSLKAVEQELPPPAEASHVTAAGCDLYVEGLADPKAEEQRKGRRADELAKTIAALKGRLANEAYTAKAPPHLVQQTRDQLAEAEAELAKVRVDQ